MACIWLISDTHFGHANILTFSGPKGLIRPGFGSSEEMDELMVQRWNEVVRPSDHVYHLGDVAMKKKDLAIVQRLNGKKRLVMGNHDIYEVKEYLAVGFQKVCGIRVMANLVLSHIPIHPLNMGRFRGNIHGHIHENDSPDGPYLNVCVEKLDYRPITLEEAQARLERADPELSFRNMVRWK